MHKKNRRPFTPGQRVVQRNGRSTMRAMILTEPPQVRHPNSLKAAIVSRPGLGAFVGV